MKPNSAHIRDEMFKDEKHLTNDSFFSNLPITDEEPICHAVQTQNAEEKESIHPIKDSIFKLLQDAADVMVTLSNTYIELSDIYNLEGDKENSLLFLKKTDMIIDEQRFLQNFIISNMGLDFYNKCKITK